MDEILANHVELIVAFARSVTAHKYFLEKTNLEGVTEKLKAEKSRSPSRIPYYLWYDDSRGRFRLSYIPNTRVRMLGCSLWMELFVSEFVKIRKRVAGHSDVTVDGIVWYWIWWTC